MIHYNPQGLTSQEVTQSRSTHGDNIITPPKDASAWLLLLEKFRDPIIRILLLAAVLSLAIGFVHRDFTESIGIICAIILATCVGFWFEWDAQRRFRRLRHRLCRQFPRAGKPFAQTGRVRLFIQCTTVRPQEQADGVGTDINRS